MYIASRKDFVLRVGAKSSLIKTQNERILQPLWDISIIVFCTLIQTLYHIGEEIQN